MKNKINNNCNHKALSAVTIKCLKTNPLKYI